MSTLEQPAPAGDSRRRIERRLADLGRHRRGWLPGAGDGATLPPRRLFEELGPVFAACGLHLASRLDLLPEDDCWELAAIADRGAETPPEAVDELVHGELGQSPSACFADFEPRPFRVRLLGQSHRARTADGEALTVEIVHPAVSERLDDDLDALELLAAPLAARALPGAAERVGDALAAARQAIRDLVDLGRKIDDPGAEAQAWTLEPRLSTARLRVLAGQPAVLAEVLEVLDDDGDQGPPAADLARHLWLRWLWQVLRTGRIPVDPRPETVFVAAGSWPLFDAAGVRPRPEALAALDDYLTATAGHDPDAACDAVLRLASPRPASDRGRLRRRFRQLMPFRDSRRLGDGDTAAASLLLHQRLLAEGGFRVAPPLAELYRSLFWIHRAARRLAPGRELLAEAVEELRLAAGLGELRRQLDLARLAEDLKKHGSLFLELPQKLDAVLTRAMRDTAADAGAAEPGDARSTGNAALRIAALFAAAVAVAAVGRRLADLGPGAWDERLGALLLLLAGAWFLTLAGRARP